MTIKPKSLKKAIDDIFNTMDEELQKEVGYKPRGNASRNPKVDANNNRVPVAVQKARAEEISKISWADAPQAKRRNPRQDFSNKRVPQATRESFDAEYDAYDQAVEGAMEAGENAAIRTAQRPRARQKVRQTGEGTPGTSNDREEHPLKYEDINTAAANPSTVKNCKRAKTMGHKLSTKCKQILAMKGEQTTSQSVQGHKSGMPYTDLNTTFQPGRGMSKTGPNSKHCMQMRAKYGEQLQESEKYYADIYMKGMAGSNAVIKDTETLNNNGHLKGTKYSDIFPADIMSGGPYGVRAAHCGGRKQADTLYTKAPIMTGHKIDPARMKMLLNEFFRDKEAFMRTHSEFDYETIAIKGVLIAINEDEEMGMEGAGGGEFSGMSSYAEAPQPLAASESDLEDWDVDIQTIAKARKAQE